MYRSRCSIHIGAASTRGAHQRNVDSRYCLEPTTMLTKATDSNYLITEDKLSHVVGFKRAQSIRPAHLPPDTIPHHYITAIEPKRSNNVSPQIQLLPRPRRPKPAELPLQPSRTDSRRRRQNRDSRPRYAKIQRPNPHTTTVHLHHAFPQL